MKRLVLIAGLLAVTSAFASGDYGPSYTRYKAYTKPDDARFQAGALGVLQPGMKRVYLYTAWRAISLGPKIAASSGVAGGLQRADGSVFESRWEARMLGQGSQEEWLRVTGLKESNFDACPLPSSQFALDTFKAASKRPDATPARLKMWINAQELVFAACKAEQESTYNREIDLSKVLVAGQITDKEPLYWRQLRDYQRAATLFHAAQYHGSTPMFDRIGAAADHPMRTFGHYLALRSQVRMHALPDDSETQAERDANLAQLQKRGQAILDNPSLAVRHEATRATLRSIRAYLAPATVMDELSRYLANPAVDPFADDRLGDWVMVMNRLEDRYGEKYQLQPARDKYEFVEWIENLHDCGYSRNDKDPACALPAQRALAQWQRSKSRPWLTASLMLASSFGPGQEAAALAVKPADPEFVTVRYHLARLYRLAGRMDESRAVSDAALKLTLSPGSRNLFREERFAVATSVADAAPYMTRTDIDRSEESEKPVVGFNDDALNWMLNRLSTADMVQLARRPELAADLRSRLASGAWVRAELLGKSDIALQAVDVLEPLMPAMKKDLAAYRGAREPVERHHQMLLSAIRFGLSPQMAEDIYPIAAVPKEEVTASSWCSFKPDTALADDKRSFPWRLPPPPAAGDTTVARTEIEKLGTLKTSTGYLGDHVLARVNANPADPDLPWLLHVVVKSTRGGCLDADSKKLSRDAFNVLKKRFPGHEWQKKTPYFY